MLIYDGSQDKISGSTTHTIEVVSSSCIYCGSIDHMTIRAAGRKDWSLFYCVSGCIHFPEHLLQPGQIWIYPPATPQKYIIYNKDDTSYHYLHFIGSDIPGLLASLGIPCEIPLDVSSPFIVPTFDSIQTALLGDTPTSRLVAEYQALHLITQISKEKKQHSEVGMMKRVIDKMEHSFALPYDASLFAEMLNVSVSRFHHLFKQCVGQSPYAYYLNLRIENAASLLEHTSMKIKEVSEQCGFDDPLYFAQVFKRIKGTSPREYRSLSSPHE